MIRGSWLGRMLGLRRLTRADHERELHFHIEERVEELVRQGWREGEARREVEGRFGSFEHTLAEVERIERQRVQRGRARTMVDAGARMVRVTWRSLARAPIYSLTVIATLALGIGASTAMFSVLYGALLSPLPYPDADELVRVHNQFVETGGSGPFSVPNFLDIQDQNRVFDEVAGYQLGTVSLADDGTSEQVRVATVTSNFLRTLEVGPVLGRDFDPGADRSSASRVALISHQLWTDRFGADRDVLGETLRLDGVAHTVIGVMGEGFWFSRAPQVIRPFAWDDDAVSDALRGNRSLPVIGRLAPGVDPTDAAADLTAITDRIALSFPANAEGWVVTVEPFDRYTFASSRASVLMLSGAVALVLLIGCVNVVNLMLVRSERRGRETAVRAALGAGRGSIMAHHLMESLSLAAVAGILGVGLAHLGLDLVLALYGSSLPRSSMVGIDAHALLAALGLTLATGISVGLVPALRIHPKRLQGMLRGGGRGSAGGSSLLQRSLVVGQIALAVVLVTGAGLMIQSFRQLGRVDLGVDPRDALVFSVRLTEADYPTPEERQLYFEQATQQIGRLAEVEAVGISERTPLLGGYNITSLPSPDDPEVVASFVEVRRVSPDFFQAAGIPLVRGRLFEPAEWGGGANVVLISDQLASTLFPDGDVLGKRILPDWNEVGYEVIGVVGSVREFGVTRDLRPAVYWPFGETDPPLTMNFVVRARGGSPLAVLPEIRTTLSELDPAAPIFGARAMEDVVFETVGSQVFATTLLIAFGVFALGLASLGIFSLLAYMVEQRTREIGIRLALGASRVGVQKVVATQAMTLVGVGMVVGITASLLGSRLIASLLFQVRPADLWVLSSVVMLSLVVAVLAAWLPARSATRIDPMIAMRVE